MLNFLGVPLLAIWSQFLVGLMNGAFYAMLSLGLAIIFGLLRVINFAHGALYMLGAMVAWILLAAGVSFWAALLLAPAVVGVLAAAIEKLFLSRLYKADHLYGLLLTYGFALVMEGSFTHYLGTSGKPYPTPELLQGALSVGSLSLPLYRVFVVGASLLVCAVVWLVLERTRIGATVRAARENPVLVQVFGINVPLLLTLIYTLGAMLAALTGVLAAPIYQVSPVMGQSLIIVVFAVVVVGGMGSIAGAIVSGFALGLLEAAAKLIYPEGASIVVFVIMALVLLACPNGLFGREQ